MKMSLVEQYSSIYCDDFISTPKESHGRYSVDCIENDPSAKLKKVMITDVPKNSILLNMDKLRDLNIGEKLKSLIKSEIGAFKICDYLLVSDSEQKSHLIFVEMKSESIENEQISKQFKSTRCFMKYCDAILEHFNDVKIADAGLLVVSYVLFSLGKPGKGPLIKPNKYRGSIKPENFVSLKFSDSSKNDVSFKKIITSLGG